MERTFLKKRFKKWIINPENSIKTVKLLNIITIDIFEIFHRNGKILLSNFIDQNK